MFRSSSRLLDRSMDELLHMDFKYFQAQNQKIAISQVTSVSENELSGIRDKMLEYMESCLASSGLSMLFAMLTNIIEEKTELLYVGKGAQQLVRAAFKTDCGELGRPARCRQPQEADGGAACQSHGARRGNWVRFAE